MACTTALVRRFAPVPEGSVLALREEPPQHCTTWQYNHNDINTGKLCKKGVPATMTGNLMRCSGMLHVKNPFCV
eukprot:329629-Amphidinium_carterae.1